MLRLKTKKLVAQRLLQSSLPANAGERVKGTGRLRRPEESAYVARSRLTADFSLLLAAGLLVIFASSDDIARPRLARITRARLALANPFAEPKSGVIVSIQRHGNGHFPAALTACQPA